MAQQLCITNKIHNKLKRLAEEHGLYLEAVGNILLFLALNDEKLIEKTIKIIKEWDLNKGCSALEKFIFIIFLENC